MEFGIKMKSPRHLGFEDLVDSIQPTKFNAILILLLDFSCGLVMVHAIQVGIFSP
jgi:hypothetical protein